MKPKILLLAPIYAPIASACPIDAAARYSILIFASRTIFSFACISAWM